MSDEVSWSEVEYLASTTGGDMGYRTAARVARLALAERERADGWAQTARCEPHIERAEKAEAEVGRWPVSVESYHDFIEELCALIPEDDVGQYANPEGAAESIITDCFRAYRAERDELQRGYDAAVEQVESEMDKRIKAEAERDEWKRRRDNAVETCRFRHQEGLTAREWLARICGAMQGLERVEVERDEARADYEEAVAALRETEARAERDTLRAAAVALADEWASARGPLGTTVNDLVQRQCATELRSLLDDPDAALRAVKAQVWDEVLDHLEAIAETGILDGRDLREARRANPCVKGGADDD